MGTSNSKPLDVARVRKISTEITNAFNKEFPIVYKDAIYRLQLKLLTDHQQHHQNHESSSLLSLSSSSSASPSSSSSKSPSLATTNAAAITSDKLGLLAAPHPTKIIKRGEMYKKGAINTGWKKRMFVALNRADNYEIEYAEDDSMKGRINCFGYNVEIFSEDDVAKDGFTGFTLKPNDSRQRKWYFRCDTEQDQNEWIEIFTNACRNAAATTAPPVHITLEREAFVSTYRLIRANYGYFGIFNAGGSEVDMIVYLITHILRREMLDDYIISESALHITELGKQKVVRSVDKSVDRIIKPIAQAMWSQCLASCECRKTFQEFVSVNMELFFSSEQKMLALVRNSIGSLAKQVMGDLEFSMRRCVDRVAESVIVGFEEALLWVVSDMIGRLASIAELDVSSSMDVGHVIDDVSLASISMSLFNQSFFSREEAPTSVGSNKSQLAYDNALKDELDDADEAIENITRGPLHNSQAELWKMFTENLTEVSDVLDACYVSAFEVYTRHMDAIRGLIRDFLYTLRLDFHQKLGLATVEVVPRRGSRAASRRFSNGRSGSVSSPSSASGFSLLIPGDSQRSVGMSSSPSPSSISTPVYANRTAPLTYSNISPSSEIRFEVNPATDHKSQQSSTSEVGISGRSVDATALSSENQMLNSTFADCEASKSNLTANLAKLRVSEDSAPEGKSQGVEASLPPPPIKASSTMTAYSAPIYTPVSDLPSILLPPGVEPKKPDLVMQLFRTTVFQLCSDARIKFRATIEGMLTDLLEHTIQELLLTPTAERMRQRSVRSLVPKELRGSISPNLIGDNFVRSMELSFIDHVIEDLCTHANGRFERLAYEFNTKIMQLPLAIK